ncbi:MAG: hypothetical protein ACPL0C_03645 [Candidatus Bathyarchaeales archaeon]
MSLEIQELPDIIRVIALLNIGSGAPLDKHWLKRKVDKYCAGFVCVDIKDIEEALEGMSEEGLLVNNGGIIKPTEKGLRLSREWRNLLLKREPVLEVVAGLADGSITGLVAVLSAFIANLPANMAAFSAILSLAAVAITNFSSFLLDGKTEDLADLLTLKALIDHSLSDIPDKVERDKSLKLVRQLFIILRKEINRSNIYAALIASTTTFLAGIAPIITYLMLPKPFSLILSMGIVGTIIGVFLVRYRSQRTKVHWKITLGETTSLILGGIK